MTKSILIETCRCKLCTIKTFWLVVCTSKMKWNRLIFICSLSLHYGWNLVKQSDAEFSNSKQIYQLFLTKSFRIFLCVFVMRLILLGLGIFVSKTEIKIHMYIPWHFESFCSSRNCSMNGTIQRDFNHRAHSMQYSGMI